MNSAEASATLSVDEAFSRLTAEERRVLAGIAPIVPAPPPADGCAVRAINSGSAQVSVAERNQDLLDEIEAAMRLLADLEEAQRLVTSGQLDEPIRFWAEIDKGRFGHSRTPPAMSSALGRAAGEVADFCRKRGAQLIEDDLVKARANLRRLGQKLAG